MLKLKVAEILSLPDLNYIYRNNLQCNINTVKLFEIYKEKWKRGICMKPKLRNYIQIKDDYHTAICKSQVTKRRQSVFS